MFSTKYQGSFYSIDGDVWTVCIQQDVETPFASVIEVEPSASPLQIEWPECSQEESVAGSCATLTLNSLSDREFIDLYSIGICEYRLLVYHNDALYWSGTLDTEFSEEPYDRALNYDVQFTFSDFGVLDRIPYALSGRQTLEAILQEALSRACLSFTSVDESLISSYIGQTRATLDKLAIQSENFYDEDGEAMSYREVIESMLQPLGMKMVQKAGKIYIYDLNGLHEDGTVKQIEWVSGQRISSDKVFNNIKISLSTYAGKTSTPEFKYTGKYSASQINKTNVQPSDGVYYSYYEDYGRQDDEQWDTNNVDFTIFLGPAQGLADKHPSASYFHILPVLGSEESEGVSLWFYTGGHGSLASGFPRRVGLSAPAAAGATVLKTQKVYLPPLTADQAKSYRLRISQEMLLDARYNPFVEKSKDNELGNQQAFEKVSDIFLPVKIQLYDATGNVIGHYVNRDIALQANLQTCTLARTLGQWESGAADYDDCLLQYYDQTKDNEGPILTGWKTNRQTAGLVRGTLYDSFKKLPDGQVIPYPEQGGYLEVTVCGGMTLLDISFFPGECDVTATLMPKARWMMFKAPVIELLQDGVALSEVDINDVEYTGVLNTFAKDSLDLDTICGTMQTPNPAARALYFNASTGAIISELTRAGRTTQVEQLLIGTLYSQFASRKMKLSGSSALDASGLCCLSDASQPSGRKFITLAENQMIREAENDIVAVELRPDEYYSEND